MGADDAIAALRGEFLRVRGYWSPQIEEIARLDPGYFRAFLDFSAVPWRHGTLEPKVRELIYIAVAAATTHLYEPALRAHIRNALRHGATREEIMEVFELVSVLGIHAISLGFPALAAVAGETGRGGEIPSGPLSAHQEALKQSFIDARGYWSGFWESVLLIDPPLFAAYAAFSSVPWQHGPLPPKIKEFIYVAIDAATTHMFDEGTRAHMKNAFAHGATVAELVEVLELTSVIGFHSLTLGVPVLLDELKRAESHPA